MPVVLYDIKQKIVMIQRAAGAEPSNIWDRDMDLDNADFRIYKGVDNKIEFLLRNTDRKPVSLVGRTIRIVFTNRHSGIVVSNQLVDVIDEHKGSCSLLLTKDLTQNWPEGALSYAALVEDSDGHQFLLFADHNQRANAYCYVTRSPVTPPVTSSTQVYHFPTLKANITNVRRIQIVKDGVGMDTTDYTFAMQIRTGQSVTSDLLATLTQDNGGLNVIREQNDVYLEMKIGPFTGVTAPLVAYYDLVATKSGESMVWLEGTIPLEPGVTY